MSDNFKPLWKRVNWNNDLDNEEGECEERRPLIRESTAIQVENDLDRINEVPRQLEIHSNMEKAAEEAHKTIGKLLSRGDDLDDIRQKAETLEDSSKLFKKTTRDQKDQVWWEHFGKSLWTYAFATLCALGGLLLLITIIESLKKMFSPAVPPGTSKPPATGAPPPAPQPAPGNPGTAIPAFTCNCYCPPIYYPAPPQQTPHTYHETDDPWQMYAEQTALNNEDRKSMGADIHVPFSEIPDV